MSNELDLRDYLQIVRKRIWWIIGFVLIITILAGGYSKFVQHPIYEASTKIIVNRASDAGTGATQLNSDTINTNIRLINTYKEIIKTPAVLEKVVAQHPEFGLTSDQILSKIAVNSVNDTQVMTVIVHDHSYQLAAQLANAVSEVFKQEIPGIFNVQNVSILNQAKIDVQHKPAPVSPNVLLNVIVAFVVSTLIAVGVALLLEYLDDTIKTEKDIERYLSLPTLATISRINQQGVKKTRRSKSIKQAGELTRVPVSK